MKPSILLLLVIVCLYSCSPQTLNGKESLLKDTSYVYLYHETEKECLDSQPDPDFFMNCHQQVDFYKDNRVEIMLSDIYWRGKYKMEGTTVVLKFEPNHEIPNGEIVFEVFNPVILYNLENETIWRKLSGTSIWE